MATTLQYIREGLANGQQVFRRSVLEKLMDELDNTLPVRSGGTKSLDCAVYEHEIAELKAMLRNKEKRLAEAERNLSIERKRVFDLQRKQRRGIIE